MSVRPARRANRDADGFVALELTAGFAVLVFPVVMLVASLPGWFDRQSTARQAAREAVRAVTLVGWCDEARAARVVAQVASGAGVAPGDVALTLDCTPGGALARNGTVTARVAMAMPGVNVPLVGSIAAWTWTAGHIEPVDPYGSRP